MLMVGVLNNFFGGKGGKCSRQGGDSKGKRAQKKGYGFRETAGGDGVP